MPALASKIPSTRMGLMLLGILAVVTLLGGSVVMAKTQSQLGRGSLLPALPALPVDTATSTPTPTGPPCGLLWRVVPSANANVVNNYLVGVAVVSANDVWAVGYSDSGIGSPTALIERWDGTQWSIVPDGNAGLGSQLKAVVAASANDVWAVGTWLSPIHTLVEHWNGTQWNIVTSPNPGSTTNGLNAVVAVSATDVWATGGLNDGGTYQPLIEHWNGTQWSVVPSPADGFGLLGLAALAPNDIWAVGNRGIGTLT
jgi:hypothetical protein